MHTRNQINYSEQCHYHNMYNLRSPVWVVKPLPNWSQIYIYRQLWYNYQIILDKIKTRENLNHDEYVEDENYYNVDSDDYDDADN